MGVENTQKKVLVIDDDLSFADVLAAKINNAGMKAVVMATGKEALDYLAINTADFIIVDFIMPEMDGYTFSHVLEHDLRKSIPTVVLTNFPEQKHAPQDLEVYVKTEVNLDEFVEKIKKRLSA